MRALLLVSLLALSACRDRPDADASVPVVPVSDTTAATADPSAVPEGLYGHAWQDTDSSAAQGSIRVFLPDQTVLTTSCTEVYRIDRWRADGAGQMTITEDTADIPTAYTLDGDRLTLRMTLVGGETMERTYQPVAAPVLCPDLR